MEFWGVEVPSGKPLTCKPGPESYVHVSQAALGENKSGKGSERVLLKVKTGAMEVVVGTLSQGKCDQTSLDLIFEQDFVLSHNGGSSVYFCGYKTDAVKDDMGSSDEEDEFVDDSDEDDAEPMELVAKENGKAIVKPGKPEVAGNRKVAPKPLAAKAEVELKPKEKPSVPEPRSKGAKGKGGDKDESDDDEDEEDDDEEDDDEAEDMLHSDSDDLDLDSDEEDESDDEDEDESDEEKQPKSAGEKRPAPTAQKPNSAKKAKPVTPGKIDAKSPSAPASTPKQQQQSGKKEQPAKKTPGKENNTPTSGKKLGQFLCQPCKKNFNSESALTQHQAAKHK